MAMENNILQHRLAVQQNISKAFENDFDVDIEKGKWQVGMTKQYQGKTYKVGGFNAKGNPLWKLVKNDNGGGKSDEGGSAKQQTQNQQASTQQNNSSKQKVLGTFHGLAMRRYDNNDAYYYKRYDGKIRGVDVSIVPDYRKKNGAMKFCGYNASVNGKDFLTANGDYKTFETLNEAYDAVKNKVDDISKDYDAQKNLWSEMVSRGSKTVQEIEDKIKDVEKELSKTTDKIKIATLQAQRDGYKEGISKFKDKVRKRIEALEYQKKSIDDDIAKLKKQLGDGTTTQNTTAKTQPKTTVSPQTNKPKTTVSDSSDPKEQFASKLKKESKLYVLKYDSAVDGIYFNKENVSGKDAAAIFLSSRNPKDIRFFKDEKDYKNARNLINKIVTEYSGDSGQDYTVIDRLRDDLSDVEKKALRF